MKLMTTAQAAEFLNVPKATLTQWRYLGRGPEFVKFNARCIRYKLEQLEAWIASCIRTSTSDSGMSAMVA